jgi:DNA polymerase-3 subunit epsilon
LKASLNFLLIILVDLFTVVDIETTGGTAKSHRIIEVAIVTVDGGQIVDQYETLINPQRYIPPFITSLTGITNEMVEQAPTFAQVANTIVDKTEGKVFVAHNVNFDYSFVKEEFNILGIRFDRKKLCTVRLAKKIFPGFKSYGLGTLTGRLGIQINDRHRALGDAEATAKVLALLIKNDQNDFIGYSLKKTSREATLPANLPKEVFDSLPEKVGVYYFHNGKGKVVYVGKAKNIKSRIIGHFTGDSGKGKRLFHENVHNISYELTGNELIALLLESREIKRLWPEYNRSQKFTSANHGLYQYADRNGYQRFTVSKIQAGARAITNFRSFQEGRNFLNEWVKKFKLCAKFCGLQKSAEACFDHKLGMCDGACKGDISAEYYNKRVALALESLVEDKKTYAIVGTGRERQEKTLVLVENGIYLGHGFADYQVPARSFDELKDRISPFSDNHDIQKILNMHLNKPNGDEVIYF